jgi:hypothetical protein
MRSGSSGPRRPPPTAKVAWVVANNRDKPRRQCGTLTRSNRDSLESIPTRLADAQEKTGTDTYLIATRVEYPHPIAPFLRKPFTITRWSYALPRNQRSPNDIQLKATDPRWFTQICSD